MGSPKIEGMPTTKGVDVAYAENYALDCDAPLDARRWRRGIAEELDLWDALRSPFLGVDVTEEVPQ